MKYKGRDQEDDEEEEDNKQQNTLEKCGFKSAVDFNKNKKLGNNRNIPKDKDYVPDNEAGGIQFERNTNDDTGNNKSTFKKFVPPQKYY